MEKNNDWSIITIKVNKHIKEELDKLKIIPEEHMKNVIQRLIDHYNRTIK